MFNINQVPFNKLVNNIYSHNYTTIKRQYFKNTLSFSYMLQSAVAIFREAVIKGKSSYGYLY
jgi:hypothetical protein